MKSEAEEVKYAGGESSPMYIPPHDSLKCSISLVTLLTHDHYIPGAYVFSPVRCCLFAA